LAAEVGFFPDFAAEVGFLVLFAALLATLFACLATGVSGALALVYTLTGVTSFFSLFFSAVLVVSLRGVLDLLLPLEADFLVAELAEDLTIFLIIN